MNEMSHDWFNDDPVNFSGNNGFQQAANEKTPEASKRTTGLSGAISAGNFVSNSGSAMRSSTPVVFGKTNRQPGNLGSSYMAPRVASSQDSATKKTSLPPPGFSLSVNKATEQSPEQPSSWFPSSADRTSKVGSKTRQLLNGLNTVTQQPIVSTTKSRTIETTRNSLDVSVPSVKEQRIRKTEAVRGKTKQEVVDLLDDDVDVKNVENTVNQSITKQYGLRDKGSTLSSVFGSGNNSAVHAHRGGYEGPVESFEASHIYLGLKLHHSAFRCQRFRIIPSSSSLELCLTSESSEEVDSVAAPGPALQHLIERIPLDSIRQIQCGKIDPKLSQGKEESAIALHVIDDYQLNYMKGLPRYLDPTLNDNPKYNPAKYILIVTKPSLVDKFVKVLSRNNDWQNKLTENKREFIGPGCIVAHRFPEERLAALTKLINRKNRRKNRSSAVIDFTDPADCVVHVVYPIEIDALDAITIYAGDLKRLQPCEYLNDNLIDLKIKHMVNQLDEAKRAKVHAFSCLFYGKLTELSGKDFKAAHSLVARWTKSLDLFDLDFIIIPINLTFHWSVCFLTNPGLLKAKMDEYLKTGGAIDVDAIIPHTPSQTTPRGDVGSVSVTPEDSNVQISEEPVAECRLLFMDSLNMHPMGTIAKAIKHYLFHEWESRVVRNQTFKKDDEKLKSDDSAAGSVDEKASTVQEGFPPFDIERATKFFVDSIPHMKCNVPNQPNGYDCGVYVIKYVEMVLNSWPTTFLRRQNKRQSYSDDKINKNAFQQSHVDEERDNLRALLDGLHDEWVKVREQYKAEHGEDPSDPQSPGFHAIADPSLERAMRESLQEYEEERGREVGEDIMEKSSDEEEEEERMTADRNQDGMLSHDEKNENSSTEVVETGYISSNSSKAGKREKKKRRELRSLPVESTEDIPESLNNDFVPSVSTDNSLENPVTAMELDTCSGDASSFAPSEVVEAELNCLPRSKRAKMEKNY